MLHLSYYISVTFLQAVSPDFMRVFRAKAVENRANSDDFGPAASGIFEKRVTPGCRS